MVGLTGVSAQPVQHHMVTLTLTARPGLAWPTCSDVLYFTNFTCTNRGERKADSAVSERGGAGVVWCGMVMIDI